MKKAITIFLIISSFFVQAQVIASAALKNVQASEGYTPENWIRVYREMYVGYLDEEGNEIVPAVYDEVGEFGIYKDDWALVTKNDLMGFIDTTGNEVVIPQYEGIGVFDEYRKGWLQVYKNGYIGFIDESGNEVVKPIYTDVAPAKHD